jgi:hypothetical protein
VIINSPDTEKALEVAKQLYEIMILGVAAWNDVSNNKVFLADEIHLTNNGEQHQKFSIMLFAVTFLRGCENKD